MAGWKRRGATQLIIKEATASLLAPGGVGCGVAGVEGWERVRWGHPRSARCMHRHPASAPTKREIQRNYPWTCTD